MARTTEQKITGRKSMRQTMAQGFKTLGGRDVPNYTLLFMDGTSSKPKGAYETIVIPYVELGRSSNCQIRFGEEWSTVSRQHAAIYFENGQVFVKNLSSTNPTLVNGTPIGSSHPIQNGDVIELSNGGPKLRFNSTPTNTSSMKFTQRMQLFASQALRPYKWAVLGLGVLLLCVVGLGGWKLSQLQKDNVVLEDKVELAYEEIEILQDERDGIQETLLEYERQINSGATLSASERSRRRNLERKLEQLEDNISSARRTYSSSSSSANYDGNTGAQGGQHNSSNYADGSPSTRRSSEVPSRQNGSGSSSASSSTGRNVYDDESADRVGKKTSTVQVEGSFSDELEALKKYEKYVYLISATKLEYRDFKTGEVTYVSLLNGALPAWTGTGFKTEDNKFYTARHVIEPWRFLGRDACQNETSFLAMLEDGGDIKVHFVANSSDGSRFTFTSDEFTRVTSGDVPVEIQCSKPVINKKTGKVKKKRVKVKVMAMQNGKREHDWVYIDYSGQSGGLPSSKQLSQNLQKGEAVTALGFPAGMYLQDDEYNVVLRDKQLAYEPKYLDPQYSNNRIANARIMDGLINLSNTSVMGGYSGGPVIAKRDGEFYVVGIVVSGLGSQFAMAVPMQNITR